MSFSGKKRITIALAVVASVVVVFLSIFLPLTLTKKKVAHIIVIAGQSNCEGVSRSAELKKYVTEEKYDMYSNGISNVNIVLNTNGVAVNDFTPCKLGYGTSDEHFGIELGIADYLNERYPNEEFYIVKRAHGGTSIYPYWHAPASNVHGGMYFAALLEKVDEAISVLESQGKKVVVEAYCWMQGEQDATNAGYTNTYMHYLSEMVSYFRNRYKSYNSGEIRFVDAGISKYDLVANYRYREINQIKENFSKLNKNNYYIDTIGMGLTLDLEPQGNPDLIHYDSYAMFRLGRAFGEFAYAA